MIAGKTARRFGEAKNSWLTGTAAWNFVALSQYICGVRPEFDGLRVEPRLPSHVKKAELTRVFRGTTYHISVVNKNNEGKITLSLKDEKSASVNETLVKASKGAKDVYITATVE